jgi:crotonobetainyl-CoA:carnitine CoA-transferase CaiB-like acyl-CoA transferase
MNLTGEVEGESQTVGIPICDFMAGIYAAMDNIRSKFR